MAIVTDQEIFDYLGEDDSADPTPAIATVRDEVEAWIQAYCDRQFESASYAEWYNSYKDGIVVLRQYPVTALAGISSALTEAIWVKNNTAVLSASVTSSATGLSLVKDGGTATSLLFATYPTLQLLVAAINALSATGWEATLVQSSYANISPSFLQEKTSGYCVKQNTSLYVPDFSSAPTVELDSEKGIIYRSGGFAELADASVFASKIRSVFVTYTAGYSTTTMPKELKLAVKILTKYILQRKEEEGFGARSQSSGGISFTNEEDLPWEVLQILNVKFKKRHV